MTYSMKCPMCESVLRVEEDMEDEALVKMIEAGKKHLTEDHPSAPKMTAEAMEDMIKKNWKKE